MKPEDRITPEFKGGMQGEFARTKPEQQDSKSEVLQFDEKGRGLKDRTKGPQVDERTVAPYKPSVLTSSMLRDCVLFEYNGHSDEFVLGGKVTAQEALALYKTHFAKEAEAKGIAPQEVEEVSPAEIIGAGGKKTIWLPVLWSRGQMIQKLKGEKARLTQEINQLRGANAGLRAVVKMLHETLQDKDEEIAALERIIEDGPLRRLWRWVQFWG